MIAGVALALTRIFLVDFGFDLSAFCLSAGHTLPCGQPQAVHNGCAGVLEIIWGILLTFIGRCRNSLRLLAVLDKILFAFGRFLFPFAPLVFRRVCIFEKSLLGLRSDYVSHNVSARLALQRSCVKALGLGTSESFFRGGALSSFNGPR